MSVVGVGRAEVTDIGEVVTPLAGWTHKLAPASAGLVRSC